MNLLQRNNCKPHVSIFSYTGGPCLRFIHILQSSQKQGLCPQRITSSVLHHPSWPGGTSTPAPIIQMTDVIDNEAESQAAGSDCLAGGTDFRRGGGVKIYCAADEHRSGFLKHSETFPSHLSKWTKMKWVKRTKQLPESSMSRRKWKKTGRGGTKHF